jgi:uncharacterized protein (DUF1501 family)
MNRRDFLTSSVAALSLPLWAQGSPNPYAKNLILVELKGANDGLNTLVPTADPAYLTLRPNVHIKSDAALALTESLGLHPALTGLMPHWANKQLAVIQGVGYPKPNLSHFRSIEIWESASNSDEYLQNGWLARALNLQAPPKTFTADGAIVGGVDMGPLLGASRAIQVQNIDAFIRNARLADPHGRASNAALQHLLKVESDIRGAAAGIQKEPSFKTEFPRHAFGESCKTALHLLTGSSGMAAVRVSLNGFDTHINQLGSQQTLFTQLSEGLQALTAGLTEMGRWQDSLILTYSEFGRRARENASNGTDHGTASVQFALGGRVKGGLYGSMPSLTALSGDGNLIHTADFRSIYSTVLRDWWGMSASQSQQVLGGAFAPVGFV